MDKTETKTVYAYDTKGSYIGDKVLNYTDQSPISGTWQIPAGCTETVPLAVKDDYDVFWSGSNWEYKEQTKVEDTTPADNTTTIGPSQPTLADRVSALEALTNKTVMG